MFPLLMVVCNTDMLVGSAQSPLRWAYYYVGLGPLMELDCWLIFWGCNRDLENTLHSFSSASLQSYNEFLRSHKAAQILAMMSPVEQLD